MRKDKRYVLIVTSEDERYADGHSLSLWANNPAEGLLVDIVFGNNFKELYGKGEHEGLFYQLYETGTGKRIGYGVLDPDGPAEEIAEWERTYLTLQNFDEFYNNSKVIGRSVYTVLNKAYSEDVHGWTIREMNFHSPLAANTHATYDLQAVLDRFNSISGELEIINDPLSEKGPL